MKKIYSFLAAITVSVMLLAQAPNSFKYQAVVRDNSGNTINKKQVSIRISILKNNASGVSVYSETFLSITNEFGLINLEIGKGTKVAGDFSSIAWNSGDFFISVELDANGGSSYSQMGTSQLLSVPFALYANTAGNSFSGNYEDLLNKPNFKDTIQSLKNDLNSIIDSSLSSRISKDDIESWNAKSNFSGNYTELLNKPNLSDSSKYLKTESDPVFINSVARGIKQTDTSKWNAKSNFSGNYTELLNKPNLSDTSKYLKKEYDPVYSNSVAKGIKQSDTAKWNAKSDFSGKYIDLIDKPTNVSNLISTPTSGDILYYNGNNWASIPKGIDGQVLTMYDGIPQWKSVDFKLPNLYLDMVSTAPTIDGIGNDAAWLNIPFIQITKQQINLYAVPKISAQFKMSYDSNNLYLLVEVNDSTLNSIVNNPQGDWNNDCIELYLQMDTTSNIDGSYTVGDYQFRKSRNQNMTDGFSGSFDITNTTLVIEKNATRQEYIENANFKIAETDNSKIYTQEWQIPWSLLTKNLVNANATSVSPGTIWNGRYFRFDIDAGDNSDGSGRESQIFYKCNLDQDYYNTLGFALIKLNTKL